MSHGVRQTLQKLSQKRKNQVSFCTLVTVIPISSRNDYSDRIKRSLWTGADELEEQVARNCFEFAYEDWQWRLAVEDADMVYYQGQKVHPCHFMPQQDCEQYSAREHFLHCLAMQQQEAQAEHRVSPLMGYSY